jgi:hypothetical protein
MVRFDQAKYVPLCQSFQKEMENANPPEQSYDVLLTQIRMHDLRKSRASTAFVELPDKTATQKLGKIAVYFGWADTKGG